MKPKVAIYGAGQYGLEAMRIMHQKGWEIVAAYNRAGEKVGRDAGELAGIERLDVPVRDCETADYASSGANIAIHSVRQAGLQLGRPPAIVISRNQRDLSWRRVTSLGFSTRARRTLDELAKANGVTFTGTGIGTTRVFGRAFWQRVQPAN